MIALDAVDQATPVSQTKFIFAIIINFSHKKEDYIKTFALVELESNVYLYIELSGETSSITKLSAAESLKKLTTL